MGRFIRTDVYKHRPQQYKVPFLKQCKWASIPEYSYLNDDLSWCWNRQDIRTFDSKQWDWAALNELNDVCERKTVVFS